MELFRLLGTIAINNKDALKDIDDTTSKAEESGSKVGEALTKIGGAAVKIGKTTAAAVGVAATGIAALAKQSISAYADTEQLVGGVETLFGAGGKDIAEYCRSVGKNLDEVRTEYALLMKAQNTVLDNAKIAFKTAGLSANEYMETVTSFSAAMIASLDGDTVAAAEKSNQAIIDMSDNANKMGSSMESIQNAYNGFAKQNYTMLDNLKLGYGGTKEEMQRLLKDAEKLSGKKFDLSSYADVVDAIHVIQTEMGITGTTAKEAEETISGSIGMMKGAWTNFIAGMADDNADYSALVSDLVDSALTVFDNIAPRLIQTIPRLVEGLVQLIQGLIPYIPTLTQQLVPPLIEGAVQLTVALIQNLPLILSSLGKALYEALQSMFNVVGAQLPESVTNNFSVISEGFQKIWEACQYVWETIGVPIWDAIQFAIDLVRETFAEYMPEIQEFVSQAFGDIQESWENHLKPALKAIGDFLNKTLKPVFEMVFKNFIVPLIEYVFGFIKTIWNTVLKPIFNGICDFLTGVFTGNWKLAFDGIINIVKGAVNAVIGGFEWMVNSAIGSINKILAGISMVATAVGSLIGLDPVSLSIDYVNLPRLKKGGILEKGQVGLLEGDGAEAVVPLENNRNWIHAVANDMEAVGIGGSSETLEVLKRILEQLESIPEELLDAIANMKFDINNREFARLVKAVN